MLQSDKDIGVKFDVEFLRDEQTTIMREIILIYLLEGQQEISIDQDTFVMKKGDIVLVNSANRFRTRVIEEGLACNFKIAFQTLSSVLESNNFVFWCNSVLDNRENYTELRSVIKKILRHNLSHKGEQDYNLFGLLYQLLHILSTKFLVSYQDVRFQNDKSKYDERLKEILGYLQGNYQNPITLQELADRLYLSNAYLSRFIKKELGMNFGKYLDNIRLYHAVEDLLYTDKSIVRVALDNGFSNVNKFNRVFKENYHKSPSNYKKEMKNKSSDPTSLEDKEAIRYRISQYLEASGDKVDQVKSSQYIIADVKTSKPYEKSWMTIINGGSAQDLSTAKMQRHITLLKDELNFSYVRIWNIFSYDMNLMIEEESYNFDRLDEVLQFMLANKIKPFINLGQKPKILLKNVTTKMIDMDVHDVSAFGDVESWLKILDAFLKHILRHYGREEVCSWIFELWKPHHWDQNYDDWMALGNRYEWFVTTYNRIKAMIPNVKVGGVEFAVTMDDVELLKNLKEWKTLGFVPDFLSLSAYPYNIESERTSAENFIGERADDLRALAKSIDYPVKKLYVTEWNMTVSNRNLINDSCYKGAMILSNIIRSIGHVDISAYWLGSDAFSEYFDSKAVLYGGTGLISKDTIRKPAFYAFNFLKRLKKYLIDQGDDYVITGDNDGSYTMICHNMKTLGHFYHLKDEEYITTDDFNKIFVDRSDKEIKIKFVNIEPGHYEIKTRALSPEYGSVLDEWIRWGCVKDLKKEETSYLERVSTPKVSIRQAEAEFDFLNFEIPLTANEIALIEISPTDVI